MSEANRYKIVAAQMAERYGVDPEVFIRLIERESKFNPLPRARRVSWDLLRLRLIRE